MSHAAIRSSRLAPAINRGRQNRPQSAFRPPPFVSFCKFPPFPVEHFPRRPKIALNCSFLQLIAPNCAKLQFPAI
jgi:hypothetical protein